MVITARDREALEETKSLIISQAPAVSVHIVPGDLGDLDTLPALCSQLLDPLDTSRHQQCMLVNNAGTMNDFDTPFALQNDPKKIQDYLDTNFTSMMVLTTRFLSSFPGGGCYVVHITSLLGSVFVPGYSLYSISRAARNAFMGVLGAEMPGVRQFSYSPGPCDTDMLRSIPDRLKVVSKKVLTAEESIQKLVKILKDDQYKNSSIIDYFDLHK